MFISKLGCQNQLNECECECECDSAPESESGPANLHEPKLRCKVGYIENVFEKPLLTAF